MQISKIFEKKKPVLSFEIFPPKRDTAIKNIDETLKVLAQLNPDFISVTFGAGGSTVNNLTVELAKKIKNEYGIEPLVHLTCLNYTKNEILTILEFSFLSFLQTTAGIPAFITPRSTLPTAILPTYSS